MTVSHHSSQQILEAHIHVREGTFYFHSCVPGIFAENLLPGNAVVIDGITL